MWAESRMFQKISKRRFSLTWQQENSLQSLRRDTALTRAKCGCGKRVMLHQMLQMTHHMLHPTKRNTLSVDHLLRSATPGLQNAYMTC